MDILDDCLIVPVRDAMNKEALFDLSRDIFATLHSHGCRKVILNVSAVNVMDSNSFLILSNTARAVRLLGGNTVLVGIRAGVACSLVDLDLDFSQIITAATTEDARKLLNKGEKTLNYETDHNESSLDETDLSPAIDGKNPE